MLHAPAAAVQCGVRPGLVAQLPGGGHGQLLGREGQLLFQNGADGVGAFLAGHVFRTAEMLSRAGAAEEAIPVRVLRGQPDIVPLFLVSDAQPQLLPQTCTAGRQFLVLIVQSEGLQHPLGQLRHRHGGLLEQNLFHHPVDPVLEGGTGYFAGADAHDSQLRPGVEGDRLLPGDLGCRDGTGRLAGAEPIHLLRHRIQHITAAAPPVQSPHPAQGPALSSQQLWNGHLPLPGAQNTAVVGVVQQQAQGRQVRPILAAYLHGDRPGAGGGQIAQLT